MKSLGIMLLIFLFWVKGSASDSTVVFSDLSYEEVLNQAKEENKPIFLYFHFDGCGACIQMEKSVFCNEEVAEYFNQNFICHSINTREEEGIETNKIYNVKLHPTILILSHNGHIIHKMVGVFGPEELLNQVEEAMSGKKSLSLYTQKYKEGNRNPEFLFEYSYMMQNAYQLDSFLVNEYLNTQSWKDLGNEKNVRFIYEFAVHESEITTPYGGRAFASFYTNREDYAAYFDSEQVVVRLVWILSDALSQFEKDLDSVNFFTALNWLDSLPIQHEYYFKEMDGTPTGIMYFKDPVLWYKMSYAEKSGDSTLFKKLREENVRTSWDDSFTLNLWAWDYYENRTKPEDLEEALKWIKRSVQLDNGYGNNDTYAALLYKLGLYDEALERANLAVSIAKRKDRDFHETEELIEKIIAAMEE